MSWVICLGYAFTSSNDYTGVTPTLPPWCFCTCVCVCVCECGGGVDCLSLECFANTLLKRKQNCTFETEVFLCLFLGKHVKLYNEICYF